jgi:hypothetical protein
MIEPGNIRFGVEQEFHMLRHFVSVAEDKGAQMADAGFSTGDLRRELELPGSKFFSGLANNIEQLLEKLFRFPYEETAGLNGNRVLEFRAPADIYPGGIGTLAVLPISSLSDNQQSQIYFKENRSYLLAHLDVENLPATDRCTLILKPHGTGWIFITAYPGSAAMPVPNAHMSAELYQACREFWADRVFLKVREQTG